MAYTKTYAIFLFTVAAYRYNKKTRYARKKGKKAATRSMGLSLLSV
jgi:hypothetical protein